MPTYSWAFDMVFLWMCSFTKKPSLEHGFTLAANTIDAFSPDSFLPQKRSNCTLPPSFHQKHGIGLCRQMMHSAGIPRLHLWLFGLSQHGI